jgi:hypothetical protein
MDDEDETRDRKLDQTDPYNQSTQTQGQFPELTRAPALTLPQGQ